MAALTGEGDAIQVERGEVTVGLATIIDAVETQLVDAGFGIAERMPDVNATFTIVQSDDLGTMQRLLGFLDGLSTWLPIVGLGRWRWRSSWRGTVAASCSQRGWPWPARCSYSGWRST